MNTASATDIYVRDVIDEPKKKITIKQGKGFKHIRNKDWNSTE